MSDKVFRGNRGATGVFFMTLVTIATVVYWLNPPGNPGVDMACMIVIGFLIYGPVMLIGLHALELAPKKAAGTAAGFTGLFGYLGGSVAASAIVGYTVDFFGWDGGFMVMIGGSVLAVLLLIVVMVGRKASSPAAETLLRNEHENGNNDLDDRDAAGRLHAELCRSGGG
ncbi:G-3-P permease [Raoultella terrigena]|uniref:G-3-P permease n=1 Tax=Raoultella terrigena TaxID=577 RepID=A0A3P8LZF2_RAOTE|nr:G-3-P permease [Raoultella terrigena]